MRALISLITSFSILYEFSKDCENLKAKISVLESKQTKLITKNKDLYLQLKSSQEAYSDLEMNFTLSQKNMSDKIASKHNFAERCLNTLEQKTKAKRRLEEKNIEHENEVTMKPE